MSIHLLVKKTTVPWGCPGRRGRTWGGRGGCTLLAVFTAHRYATILGCWHQLAVFPCVVHTFCACGSLIVDPLFDLAIVEGSRGFRAFSPHPMSEAATRRLGKLAKNNTAFFLCDIQEKFVPHIAHVDSVIHVANYLLRANQALKCPLVVTEQYPKGLGKTAPAVVLPDNVTPIEKTMFSMMTPEVRSELDRIEVCYLPSRLLITPLLLLSSLKTAVVRGLLTLIDRQLIIALMPNSGLNRKHGYQLTIQTRAGSHVLVLCYIKYAERPMGCGLFVL